MTGSLQTTPHRRLTESNFRVMASSARVVLVDPADGSVYPTLAPMLRARALHTSTALGDGRILIAGGVSGAILGLERVSGEFGGFEYRPHIHRFVEQPAS